MGYCKFWMIEEDCKSDLKPERLSWCLTRVPILSSAHPLIVHLYYLESLKYYIPCQCGLLLRKALWMTSGRFWNDKFACNQWDREWVKEDVLCLLLLEVVEKLMTKRNKMNAIKSRRERKTWRMRRSCWEWVGETRGVCEADARMANLGKEKKENKAEQRGERRFLDKHRQAAWRGDLSPRQPLTTHVALLGASTGCRGRLEEVGVVCVWKGEKTHHAEKTSE